MHELSSVMETIDRIKRMEPRPSKVRVTLGKVRGSAKGFESMFREHTFGTSLDGIGLEIVQTNVEVRCPGCGFNGVVRVIEHVHFVRCPRCGKVADILSGDELLVERVD